MEYKLNGRVFKQIEKSSYFVYCDENMSPKTIGLFLEQLLSLGAVPVKEDYCDCIGRAGCSGNCHCHCHIKLVEKDSNSKFGILVIPEKITISYLTSIDLGDKINEIIDSLSVIKEMLER